MKTKQSKAFLRLVILPEKEPTYSDFKGAWKCIRQLSLELHVFGPAKDANYIRLQYSVMKALEEHGTENLSIIFEVIFFQDSNFLM